MTLVGILSLGIGYYIAVTIDDPLTAVYLFFIAVILVIIGTYCLFTAGSITILKFLKKNALFKKIIAVTCLFCKYSITIFIISFFKRYWHWCCQYRYIPK